MQPLKTVWKLTDSEVSEFSASTYLEHASRLAPILIARASLDVPELNAAIDSFLKEASAKNVTLDFLTHPTGHHTFDVLDDVARSHEIIKRTLEFLTSCLASTKTT